MSQESESGKRAVRWSFGTVEFDESRWELTVAGVRVELEPKPLAVLAYLLRHAGEVVTKDELFEHVWFTRIVVEASLTNAIGKLRRALGEAASEMIVTLPKLGYRLDAEVTRRAVAALPSESQLTVGQSAPRRPHWKLTDLLARHGDGEVWRAVHAKTGDARVFKYSLSGLRLNALKREVTLARVLRNSLGDERQDFVRIIDWNFDEQPFFLEAEYGGTALDVWAEDGRIDALPMADRLAFVAQVAGAVAAAHDVGVLHKDLKPANVLVWERDGRPHARVADFGSGRLLDPDQLTKFAITQLVLTEGESVMSDSLTGTPLYLAPEVVAGVAPSIKSDLYALGVMLYQVVVGDLRRPMSPGWEADVTDPLLREDITLFANGDPTTRPASAHELVTRLETLEERRVRRDTERAVQDRIHVNERKLALAQARRPWMIAAVVVLAIGLTVAVVQGRHWKNAEAAERVARLEADRSLKRADAVNAFLVKDVIGGADPFKTGVATLSLQQALDRAEKQIAVRFATEPENEAQVRIMLAQAYSGRAEHAMARAQYQRAVAVLDAHPNTDRELAYQARLHEAGTLLNLGELDEFDRVMAPVLKAVDTQPALDPKLRLYANFTTGQKAMVAGDIAVAVERLEKARSALATLPNADPALAPRVNSVLGMMYTKAGRADDAKRVLGEAVRDATNRYGARHPETLNVRILHGMALNGAGDFEEAERALQLTRADAAATHGTDSEPVLDVDQLLASAIDGKGEVKKAANLFQNVLERRVARSGLDNPLTVDIVAPAADALRRAGRPQEALELARRFGSSIPIPEAGISAALLKIRYVEACSFLDLGKHDDASRIAATLTPALLSAAEPNAKWATRVAALVHRANGQDYSCGRLAH